MITKGQEKLYLWQQHSYSVDDICC